MNCLKDWLGPTLEEAIYAALQWKKQESIDAGVDARVAYELDGAALRVTLGERGKPLQILKFLTFEDPVQAILSDSFTRVEATFATAAAQGFFALHQRRITEKTRGSIFNVKNYEVVINIQNHNETYVALLVKDFEHLGCDGEGTFGHPRNIESQGRVRALLYELHALTSKVKMRGASDEDDQFDVGSPVQSQMDCVSESEEEDQPITQMGFSTQLPGKPRKDLFTEGRTSLVPGEQNNATRNGAGRETGHARTSELLSLLATTGNGGKHKEKMKERRASVTTEVAPKMANGTANRTKLGHYAGEKHPSVVSEMPKEHDLEPGLKKGPKESKQEKASKSTEASITDHRGEQLTVDSTRLSVVTSLNHPQQHAEIEEAKVGSASKAINEEGKNRVKISTEVPKVLDLGKPDEEAGDSVWKGMTRILPRDVRISKEHQTLSDRNDCFIPPEPGQRGPIANVPITTLKSLNALADQREKEERSFQPVQEPVLPETKASQARSTPSTTSSGESSPSDNGSERLLPWGPSPTPPPHPLLPPDSSLPGSPKSLVKPSNQSIARDEVNHRVRSSSAISSPSAVVSIASSPPQYVQGFKVDLLEEEESEIAFPNATGAVGEGTQQAESQRLSSETTKRNIEDMVVSQAHVESTQSAHTDGIETQLETLEEGFAELEHPLQSQLDLRNSCSANTETTVVEIDQSGPAGPLAIELNADEFQSETESFPTIPGGESSDSDGGDGAEEQSTVVLPSTAPSKRNPTIQVKRTPFLIGEAAKSNSVSALQKDTVTLSPSKLSEKDSADSDGDDDKMAVDFSSDQIIPGTYDKLPIAREEEKSSFGGDGAADSDQDDAMVDQQIHAEIDAYSQRSFSQSPSKQDPSAAELPTSKQAQGNQPVDPSRESPSVTKMPTSTSPRQSHHIPLETKRKASDAGYLSPNITKRRKQFKGPPSFKFSQEDRQTHDPAIIGQQYRREFLSGLSSETRLAGPNALAVVNDGASSAPGVDETLSTKRERTNKPVKTPTGSVGSPVIQAPKSNSLEKQSITLPEPGYTSRDGVAETDRATARQSSVASSMHRSDALRQTISTTPQDPVNVQPHGHCVNSIMGRFKAAYPDYTGESSHFMAMCRRIEKLLAENRMEHRSLWDDYVGRHRTDYKQYVIECTEGGDDPLPYEKFYRDHVDEPKYTKRILTPVTLKEAVRLEAEPHGPRIRSGGVSPRTRDNEIAPLSTPENVRNLRLLAVGRDEAPGKAAIDEPHRSQSTESPRNRKLTESKRSSQRQLPWIKRDGQRRGSDQSRRSVDRSTSKRRTSSVRDTADAAPQRPDFKSRSDISFNPSNMPLRTPGSTPNTRESGGIAPAKDFPETIDLDTPPEKRTSATKPEPPDKSLPPEKQRSSQARLGPDKSVFWTEWLDRNCSNETHPAPAQGQQSADDVWFKDKNTPFKEFARSYAGLKSVGGALGTIDEQGVVRAKPRRFDILNWSL